MKSFDHEEKQIIAKLKQLPMIEDKLSKEEVFQRASQKSQQQNPVTRPIKLVPIISTLAVITILLVMVPSLLISNQEQTSEQSGDVLFESSTTSGEQESVSIASDQDSKSANDAAEESVESLAYEHRHVIQEIGENEAIVYGAVPDQQAQYIIPFSMVVPQDLPINDAIFALYTRFVDNVWQGGLNLFQDVQFEIDQEAGQVVLHFPQNYSIGDGSAIPGLFRHILSAMFRPYGIDTAIFQTEDDEGVDLGPYGVMSEEDLPQMFANYKLYDLAEVNHTFLIPIPQENESIEEALTDLKQRDEDFDVYETIPEQIDFTVDSAGSELILEFEPFTEPIEEDKLMTMTESILLTAKSYGYDTVSFNQLPMERIGPYQLTAPINVPLAINPIQ